MTISGYGGLKTALFGHAAATISAGEESVVLVVGGEAKASGSDVADPSSVGEPDLEMVPAGDIVTGLEIIPVWVRLTRSTW